MIEYAQVRLECEDGLATIVLDDPARMNALSPAMAEAVMRALQEAQKPRRGIRALLLRGEGRGFCAGANLAGRADDGGGNLPVLSRAEAVFHPLVERLRAFERPVVTAVQGACVGIGLALALQSDAIVASEEAFFAAPYVRLGSGPDCGLTWSLPRAIGPLRARQMLMGGRRIEAAEALSWGLISDLQPSEDFAAAASAVAMGFATGPTVALSEMRQLLRTATRADFETQLAQEERALARTFRSADNREGISAFAAKRTPSFTGA